MSKLIPVKGNSSECEHAGSDRDVSYEVAELTVAHAEYPVTVNNQVKRCCIKEINYFIPFKPNSPVYTEIQEEYTIEGVNRARLIMS